jgi:hypothetical protein
MLHGIKSKFFLQIPSNVCYGVGEVSNMIFYWLIGGFLAFAAILSIGMVIIEKIETHKRKKQQ